jgi:predicted nucleic acid-binding protein
LIVVDSSVWIDWLRSGEGELTSKEWLGIDPLDVVLGDVVLLEILRGARDENHAMTIERRMSAFRFERMLDRSIAVKAARNYRLLRAHGITARNSADLIIGTFCIERGHSLLQKDRDFLPMAQHLGLQLA